MKTRRRIENEITNNMYKFSNNAKDRDRVPLLFMCVLYFYFCRSFDVINTGFLEVGVRNKV